MRFIVPLLLVSVAGCGASSNPAEAPVEAPAPAPAVESTEAPEPAESSDQSNESAEMELPTACTEGSSNPCLMPRAFVKRLCSNAHPELALYFFAKGSPWTRTYVSVRQIEPFNGLGGPSSDKNLEFDEELLVLAERSPDLGGMTVSGVGKSYDVLRWDGTCATLQQGEVRFHRPPKPKHANVEWRRLDADIQDALIVDEKIVALSKERRQECKGVTLGVVSDKCEKADAALRARVVQVIRNGFQIPKPSRLP